MFPPIPGLDLLGLPFWRPAVVPGGGNAQAAQQRPNPKKPFIANVNDDCPRRARHFRENSAFWNSLLRQGYLVLTSPNEFMTQGGAFSATVPPSVNDDKASGIVIGSFWVDTSARILWYCVSNSIGLALWIQLAQYTSTGGYYPVPHAATHEQGGGDVIPLDMLGVPSDNTNLNATTAAHGLMPKLSGSASDVLTGAGTFAAASSGATLISRSSVATADAYATVYTTTNANGIHGCFTMKNTGGVNQLTLKITFTDVFGTVGVATQPDLNAGAAQHYEVDTNACLSALGVGGQLPATTILWEVKSTSAGNPTSYQFYFSKL